MVGREVLLRVDKTNARPGDKLLLVLTEDRDPRVPLRKQPLTPPFKPS